ncbi:MAG: Bax inhibitor-1/YccA family protein [Paludibacter sp.]|nr:Bax inhibitor-1/YccA family protein [Paludibacter sp.]
MNDFLEISKEQEIAETKRFFVRVYGWMSMALIITGLVAYRTATSPEIINFIFGERFVFYGLLILELVLVGVLVGAIQKMSAMTATIVFVLYSILNGVTLSAIFFVFTADSISNVFFITAGTFAAMSAYGYFTKKDLTKLGSILIMALMGLIIASVVNIFLNSEMLYWISSYAGVLIFVGLIAYDTQKLKKLNVIGNEGTDEDKKEAIIGALTLYLDFINLFLYLLRIFGKRR